MVISAHVIEAATLLLSEAEEASRQSQFAFKNYWGQWEGSRASTQASMFEMVLSYVLLNHYRGSEDDVDNVMRQRAVPGEEGGKGKGKGKGGKGKGKGQGKGSGDKGRGKGGKGHGKGGGAGSGGKPGQNYVYRPWGQNVAR